VGLELDVLADFEAVEEGVHAHLYIPALTHSNIFYSI
jgi:hypothetical protein